MFTYNITLIIMSSNKDDIISSIYFDRSGFGSVATTYKDSKAKDSTVTLNDVKEWYKKKGRRKEKTKRSK